MSDKDVSEVDVMLEVSPNSKEITIKMKSPTPFSVQSFIIELETYLHEISQASDQMEKPGVNKH